MHSLTQIHSPNFDVSRTILSVLLTSSRIAIHLVAYVPADRHTDIRSDRPAAHSHRRRRRLTAPAAPQPLPIPPQASTFAAVPTTVATTTLRARAGAGAEAPARSGTCWSASRLSAVHARVPKGWSTRRVAYGDGEGGVGGDCPRAGGGWGRSWTTRTTRGSSRRLEQL